jgi:hypothetical protein
MKSLCCLGAGVSYALLVDHMSASRQDRSLLSVFNVPVFFIQHCEILNHDDLVLGLGASAVTYEPDNF